MHELFCAILTYTRKQFKGIFSYPAGVLDPSCHRRQGHHRASPFDAIELSLGRLAQKQRWILPTRGCLEGYSLHIHGGH